MRRQVLSCVCLFINMFVETKAVPVATLMTLDTDNNDSEHVIYSTDLSFEGIDDAADLDENGNISPVNHHHHQQQQQQQRHTSLNLLADFFQSQRGHGLSLSPPQDRSIRSEAFFTRPLLHRNSQTTTSTTTAPHEPLEMKRECPPMIPSYSWLVEIKNQLGDTICGGVFINPSFILTTAACIHWLDGMIDPTIKVEQYGIVFDVLKKIPHPDYEIDLLPFSNYNIGLLKVSINKTLSLRNDCVPSNFPHLDLERQPPSATDSRITTSLLLSDAKSHTKYMLRDESTGGYMNRKSASVLSDLDCSRLITDSLSSTNPLHIATPSLDYSNMDGSNICVTDAAFGMQGMPLFNSYSPQHGINIHGLSSWHIEAELGDSLLPDSRIGKGGVTVYTRLSAHARWIRKVSGVIDHPRLEFVGPFQDVDVKDNTLKFSPVVVDGPII